MKSYLLFSLPFLFLLFSCNGAESGDFGYPTTEAEMTYEEKSYDQQPDPAPEDDGTTQFEPPRTQDPDSPPTPRKVIRTANYRFRVGDLRASNSRVETLVADLGGYITGLEISSSSYELNSEITIRVPAANFDTLLSALGGESEFTNYLSIDAKDVTEEYVDLETRLQTKRDVRDRYVDILRNKAQTVEEILMAEEKIRVIQEEIESREGRLRYLQSQVAMSTIHLQLYQTIEYVEAPSTYTRSFWGDLKHSLANGGELVRDIFLGLVSIWPLVLLLILLLWKGKWLYRKIRG